MPGWQPLKSISQYYHSGAVAIFVGVLAALAVFLFNYKGYKNDSKGWDRAAGKVASLAALCVAFFPTEVLDFFQAPSWWLPYMDKVHSYSAGVLFVSFIVYSLILFPKSNIPKANFSSRLLKN